MMKYAPHAVYLMKNQWSESNYKIGFSNNPGRRGAEVDFQYEVQPKILSVCWFPTEKDARAAEKLWHRYLKDHRSDDHGGREWFSLTNEVIGMFKEWSENSISELALTDNLFKGLMNERQVRDYTSKLITTVPRERKQPLINLWLSPLYFSPAQPN